MMVQGSASAAGRLALLGCAGLQPPLGGERVALPSRYRLDESHATEADGRPVLVDRNHAHWLESRFPQHCPARIALEVAGVALRSVSPALFTNPSAKNTGPPPTTLRRISLPSHL